MKKRSEKQMLRRLLVGVRVLFTVSILYFIAISMLTGRGIPVVDRSFHMSFGVFTLLFSLSWVGMEVYVRALNTSRKETYLVLDNLKSLLKNLHTVTFIFNKKGRFTYLEGQVLKSFNLKAKELVGKNLYHLMSPFPEVLAGADQVLAGKDFRYVLNVRDSFIEIFCYPMYDKRGVVTGGRGMARDITSFEHARRERDYLEERLRMAGRMEALGTLAGGFAHDFNNIIFSTKGFAEMGLEETTPDTRVYTCLEQISISCKRATDLVRQISTFSHTSDGEVQVLGLSSMIKETAKRVLAGRKSNIRLKFNLNAETPTVLMDPTAVYSMLFHVIDNALRAIGEERGVITVTLNFEQVSMHGEQAWVHVAVADTGMGMNEETRARIFDPYFTTRKPGEGMGMGLSSVYGVVTASGGFIEVESVPSKGTTFHIYLPPHDEPRVASDELYVVQPVVGATAGEHLLVVDDEPQIEALLKIALEGLGYRVSSFTDSTEAYKAFKEAPGSFDLVISDQIMPGLSGEELARRVLIERPGIPIIILTGQSYGAFKDKFATIGISDILIKPFKKQLLAERVRQLLDRKPYEKNPHH